MECVLVDSGGCECGAGGEERGGYGSSYGAVSISFFLFPIRVNLLVVGRKLTKAFENVFVCVCVCVLMRLEYRALFYRGLAELTFLGFVKETKRKTDHVAKLAWKGL